MSELDGRVIAVAGAGGGLGPAVARRLADDGATLAATDVSQERLDQLGADLGSPTSGSTAAPSTCSTPRRRAAWASDLRERFGRVDGLLHLVGGWRGGEPIDEAPLADYEWLHDLLVRTVQHTTPRLLGRPRRERARALRPVVSSTQAQRPDGTNASYAAAKAAAESWTLAARRLVQGRPRRPPTSSSSTRS